MKINNKLLIHLKLVWHVVASRERGNKCRINGISVNISEIKKLYGCKKHRDLFWKNVTFKLTASGVVERRVVMHKLCDVLDRFFMIVMKKNEKEVLCEFMLIARIWIVVSDARLKLIKRFGRKFFWNLLRDYLKNHEGKNRNEVRNYWKIEWKIAIKTLFELC